MKFKIENVEDVRSSTGKSYKKVDLTTQNGEFLSGVSVWPDFDEYPSVKRGEEVDGELKKKTLGRNTYTNLVSAGDGIVITKETTQTPYSNFNYTKKTFVPRPSREAEFAKRDEEREKGISFFNALNNSIEFLKAQNIGGFSLEDVFSTQEKLLKHYNSWKYGQHINTQIKEKAAQDLEYNPDEIPF